jgi:hypothetical protein
VAGVAVSRSILADILVLIARSRVPARCPKKEIAAGRFVDRPGQYPRAASAEPLLANSAAVAQRAGDRAAGDPRRPEGSGLLRALRRGTWPTPRTAGETRRYEDNVIEILCDNLGRLWRGEQRLRNEVV